METGWKTYPTLRRRFAEVGPRGSGSPGLLRSMNALYMGLNTSPLHLQGFFYLTDDEVAPLPLGNCRLGQASPLGRTPFHWKRIVFNGLQSLYQF